jgi:hypothetical protein
MNIVVPLIGLGAAFLVYLSWRSRKHAGAWMPAEARRQMAQELRRPPRAPLVTTVEIRIQQGTVTGASRNIALGGMLLKPDGHLSVGQPVHVSFTLPDGPQIDISAVVCRRQGEHVAVRFDAQDKQRFLIDSWVHQWGQR